MMLKQNNPTKTLNSHVLHRSLSEFTDDDGSIPKGSSVIVRRIPIVGGKPNSSKTRNL